MKAMAVSAKNGIMTEGFLRADSLEKE